MNDVELAFAELVDRRPSVRLGFEDFEFGNRLLEDASQRLKPEAF